MATDDQVLPDYFPVLNSADNQVANAMATALDEAKVQTGATVPGGFLTPAEQQGATRATEVGAARTRLRRFFQLLASRPEQLGSGTVGDAVRKLVDGLRTREFARTLPDVDRFEAFSVEVPELTAELITTACTAQNIPFAVLGPIVDPNEPEHLRRKTKKTLLGYGGPRLTTAQVARLLELVALLPGGADRDFRLRLLRAECHAGLARADAAEKHYQQALLTYHRLLPASTSTRPLTGREQFVALRTAATHLGLGDTRYRRSFHLTAEERQPVGAEYCAALGLAARKGVTGPIADQVRGYATQQLQKLGAGLNFLGYRDSHVPDLGPARLAGLARGRIASAQRAADRFEHFKTRADALVEELATLSEQRLENEIGLQIATAGVANADERVGAARETVRAIDAKSDDLLLGLGAGLAQSVFGTLSLAAGSPASVAGEINGPGVMSSLVQYLGAQEDLAHQLAAARSGLRLAERDAEIARLEQSLARSREAFVKEMIRAKTAGSFNADRFFALANAYEDMTRRHLDRACELLYLYERAVAFRRLKPLTIVEAATGGGDILIAPDRLDEVLAELDLAAAGDGRGQNAFPMPPWSLRTHYPVEFARLLQTGEMDFVISVYDLERVLHGAFNVRLRQVSVRVDGVVPAEGFVGSLFHQGCTLIRDRDATLRPLATRLSPTAAELTAAVAELDAGRADRVVVQGLVPLVLDGDTMLISSEPPVPLPEDGGFDLAPIQNYGLTGAWRLSLPGVDLRGVSDVSLRFVVSLPEPDPALDRHVRGLIDAYETELAGTRALDTVLAISVRRRFPDAFDALARGDAQLDLRDADFPPDTRDRLGTAVLAQALDAEGGGVPGLEIAIAHADVLDLVRTTRADGFTEDLATGLPELPEPQRVPPDGVWRLRLTDPARFADLDDLLLFVVYTFRRV